ncbi:glycosyltransferase family 4 protein [Spirosoma rhododendri]|uniref:Glycosyltransferase n=1 Tax=Spirosoma rhododendri TaxID=2728024 RepID=A0A7L5DJ78_9BACT|nr:glycosyltransferase family 4 protein [Spirosoma rhododendri]QJD77481.1 glycosyltransferase [Spirosoma rhododendri]
MNVVHLSTYHLSGGAGVAATRLHRAMLAQGIASTLLVGIPDRLERHQPEDGVLYLANNFLAEQTAFGRFVAERLYFLPYERSPAVRFGFSPAQFGANLTFHPAIQQADVLHLHWINFGFLSIAGLRALFALGKPVVWTIHDQWAFTGGCHYSRTCLHYQTHCHTCPYLKKPGERDLSYRLFEQKKSLFEQHTPHFVPPSQWLGDDLRRSTLLRNAPMTVIPNTIDQAVFCPVDRADANARLDLPDTKTKRLLFGSANVTDERKGFRFLAEALQHIHKVRPELSLELLVFGKGKTYLFNEIPYTVRHLGILRDADDIVAAYNAADALVVPSLEDNLPNTIMEALACGTPVVGFRTGGIPEMIEPGLTGYLADVASATDLAQAITRLLDHSDPITLRYNARHFAEAHYGERVVVKQHLELYRQKSERVKE